MSWEDPREAEAEQLKSVLDEERCSANIWQRRYFESQDALKKLQEKLNESQAQLRESELLNAQLRNRVFNLELRMQLENSKLDNSQARKALNPEVEEEK